MISVRRFRRAAGRSRGLLLAALPLAGVAGLAGLAACSGAGSPAPSGPSARTATASATTAARDLDAAAKPAVALVDGYTPDGYGGSPTASGYDWASGAGQEIDETLPGHHLFQIACSGSGPITVKVSGRSPGKNIACGDRSTDFPFSGQFHAVVNGDPADPGTYAWRILAAR